MIAAVARGSRSALVLAVVVGMVVALFTACCCLHLDRAPAAGSLPATQAGASHAVTASRDGGHTEQDCQESVATVAVGSASVPGPPVVAVIVAVAPIAGQIIPWAVAPARGALPSLLVPHLLCVMRT